MADKEKDEEALKEVDNVDGVSIVDAPSKKRKFSFKKDLAMMMYGFGDNQNPYDETLELMDDIVVEFISNMVCAPHFMSCSQPKTVKALGKKDKKGALTLTDLVFAIRKDRKKYLRAKELLQFATTVEEFRKVNKVPSTWEKES